jgi:hypothetical protein
MAAVFQETQIAPDLKFRQLLRAIANFSKKKQGVRDSPYRTFSKPRALSKTGDWLTGDFLPSLQSA